MDDRPFPLVTLPSHGLRVLRSMGTTYCQLLTRYLGRRVYLTTHGQLKIVGEVASVHDDCVRLIDTALVTELDDQGWYAQAQDDDGRYGPTKPETVVALHNIVALTCLEEDIQDIPLPDHTNQYAAARTAMARTESEPPPPPPPLEEPADPLDVDALRLDLGADLIPLADAERAGGILDRVGRLRNVVAERFGLWLPPIRVRDHARLDPQSYIISFSGCQVARGEVKPNRILAIDAGQTTGVIEGEEAIDPAFGRPGKWIRLDQRAEAEEYGYLVVEPEAVLATHLLETIQRHAHELLSFEQVRHLLERLGQSSPTVVSEVVPQLLPIRTVHQVLYRLLEESVPVRNLSQILECLARYAPISTDVEFLVAAVRISLKRVIGERFRGNDGRLHVLSLDIQLQQQLTVPADGRDGGAEPRLLEQVAMRILEEHRRAVGRGISPAVLTTTNLRPQLWRTLHSLIPQIPVLAFPEVPREVPVQVVRLIRLHDVLPEDAGQPIPSEASVEPPELTPHLGVRKIPR